jgi:hypothetical protein
MSLMRGMLDEMWTCAEVVVMTFVYIQPVL